MSTDESHSTAPSVWSIIPTYDPRRSALYRLADETRRLIDTLVSSPGTEQQFDEAAAAIRAIVDSLPRRPPGLSGRTSEASLGQGESLGHSQTYLDHSPVLGIANPMAPPLKVVDEPDRVLATAVFGAAYEGPPGHVHGGWIAASFDEVLGRVQALSGKPGMTGWLNVKYRKPTPLHTAVHFEARIDRVDGRKIFTSCTLRNPDGDLLAESEALFVSIDFARMAAVIAEASRKLAESQGEPS